MVARYTLRNSLILFISLWMSLALAAQERIVSFDFLGPDMEFIDSVDIDEVFFGEDEVLITRRSSSIVTDAFLQTVLTDRCNTFPGDSVRIYMDAALEFDMSSVSVPFNQAILFVDQQCSPNGIELIIDDLDPFIIFFDPFEAIFSDTYYVTRFGDIISISGPLTKFQIAGTRIELDNLMISNTPEDCRLLNMTADARCSGTDDDFVVDIDVEYFGVSDSCYVIVGTDTLGTYNYADFPISAGFLDGDNTTDYTIVLQDQGTALCSAEVELGTVFCDSTNCAITGLATGIPQCASTETYEIDIDFDVNNPESSQFIASTTQGIIGTFDYASLPVTVELDTTAALTETLTVRDADNADCTASFEFVQPVCDGASCLINSLDVFIQNCTNDSFDIQINVTGENVSSFFTATVNGGPEIFLDYVDLPLVIGRYPATDSSFYVIRVRDSDDASCTLNRTIRPFTCTTQPCNIFNIDAFATPCYGEIYDLFIDFEGQGLGDSVTIIQDAMILGRYSTAVLPIVLQGIVGDGQIDRYTLLADGNRCNNVYQFRKSCPPCQLELDNISAGACARDNTVIVTLSLLVQNATGVDFTLEGPGGFSGVYRYADLPVSFRMDLNQVSSDSWTVTDNENADCNLSFSYELPDCRANLCSISNTRVSMTECMAGRYGVLVDFDAQNSSDSFEVRGPGIFYGRFAYADRPAFVAPFTPDPGATESLFIKDQEIRSVCVDTVRFESFDCTVDISEVLDAQLLIYPIPTQDHLILEHMGDLRIQQISIYSLAGKLLEQRELRATQRTRIDLSGYDSGIYVLELRDAAGRQAIRRIAVD